MSAMRVTDAQIAAALRAHLPEHARSDVRGRISAEIAVTRQLRLWPGFLAPLSDADPAARRRMLLVFAAALLLAAAVLATALGAVLRRDVPVRLTADPATDPGAFVQQAFAAHGVLPPMSLLVRTMDDGSSDDHRYFVDGQGRIRHECCGAAIIIQAGRMRGSISSLDDDQPVWLLEEQTDALPGFELASYTHLESPECPDDWRYVGTEPVAGRPAHHFACSMPAQGAFAVPDRQLWLDAEFGIVLRNVTGNIHLDENGEPDSPYGSWMKILSLELGEPDAALFEPPPGMRVVTLAEYQCLNDPTNCEAAGPSPSVTRPPLTTPQPAAWAGDPPDVQALVESTLASYAGVPAMALVIEVRGQFDHERHVYSDGRGSLREELHFDPSDPASPTVVLSQADGTYESFYQEDGSILWRRYRAAPISADSLSLGLFATCADGWRFISLDTLLGAEAWHIGCGRVEYWIDRARLLVVRHVVQPDALHVDAEGRTVLSIVVGDQPPELFLLPEGAVVRGG